MHDVGQNPMTRRLRSPYTIVGMAQKTDALFLRVIVAFFPKSSHPIPFLPLLILDSDSTLSAADLKCLIVISKPKSIDCTLVFVLLHVRHYCLLYFYISTFKSHAAPQLPSVATFFQRPCQRSLQVSRLFLIFSLTITIVGFSKIRSISSSVLFFVSGMNINW